LLKGQVSFTLCVSHLSAEEGNGPAWEQDWNWAPQPEDLDGQGKFGSPEAD
jgi:hypothetical protein